MAFSHPQPNIRLFTISFQHTDANEFQSVPAPKKNLLLDYILAAEVENINSVEDATHNSRSRTWKRWIAWLAIVGWVGDPFLTRLTDAQKPRMVGGFAVSIRRGEHSHSRHTDPLVGGTVTKALSDLAKTFQDNDKPDPRHNTKGETHTFLKSIIRSFRKSDPREKPQKAITPTLLAHLYKQGKTSFLQHVADLCNGAFFFACRSCEYASTTGTRKTKIITVGCVVFRIGHRIITNKADYHTADSVSITFISQKNDMDYETITQHKTTNKLHCPVTIWSRIITRVLSLPNASASTTVNAYWNKHTNSVETVSSDQILKSLQWAARELGRDRLGYTPDEIGCHSIRSGAAMAMYLARHPIQVPTYTIMLQGRWCSDAFLRYIRK